MEVEASGSLQNFGLNPATTCEFFLSIGLLAYEHHLRGTDV